MGILRVLEPFVVFSTGESYAAGRLVDENDRVVRGRQRMFERVEAAAVHAAAVPFGTVEQATAAPGEVRTVTPPAEAPRGKAKAAPAAPAEA